MLLALAAALLGVAAGSTGFGLAHVDILWQIRVPRVLAGFGAGAALALAGALMQLLTRNALADPYVLGVSGGAAVGALGLMMAAALAGVALPEWAVALAATAGALGATALLFALAWRALGVGAATSTPATLLLVGVMIGAACSAVVSALLTLAPDAPLRGMVFWLLGDLNGATRWWPSWAAALLALALVWPRARELDWLARGDAWAATLGVAVATAGAIGFVGLVVPHALRLAGLRDAALLLPAAALGGGAFVVLADAVARTVVAPLQLPVGVVCAAVGVPAFLVLLLRGTGRR